MIDVLVVVILIVSLLGGLRAGLFSSLGSLGGMLLGMAAVPLVVPPVVKAVPAPEWRWLTGVGLVVVLLLVGSAIGSSIGSVFRRGADRLYLKAPERLLGGVVSTAVAAVVISIVGTGIATAGIPGLSAQVSTSTTLRAVDRALPDALREAGDRVRTSLFDDALLPTLRGPSLPSPDAGNQVDGAEPAPPAPEVDPNSAVLATAAESVARISGIAEACRTMPSGSGFVAAEDRVVTNAHVVAGVDSPVVTLPNGQAADGQVVYFDDHDDIAVIAVDIDARPLPVTSDVTVADSGVVQGYPGGGAFRSIPARVITAGPVQFGSQYGAPPMSRSVLRLETEIVPGNSGGPFLTADGTVGGVVFARDELHPSTGYAVTVDALDRASVAYDPAAGPVPTGQCAA